MGLFDRLLRRHVADSTSTIPGGAIPPSRPSSARPELDLDRPDERRAIEYGATGTLNYKGWLTSSDYNADLRWPEAGDVYERMRRSDPAIRETLWHIFAPILNADWTVEAPANASDVELEATAFVRAAFFEWLHQPWGVLLRHALSYLEFGHAVFEPGYMVVERGLVYEVSPEGALGEGGEQNVQPDQGSELSAGGEAVEAAATPPGDRPPPVMPPAPPVPEKDVRRVPPRQFITWRRFAPRLPKTIWYWNTDENSELFSITQQVPKNQPDGSQLYELIEIPAEYLVVLTNEQWGDEFTGVSLLRPAYKPFVLKELIERIAGIAYERHGVGIPVAYIPRDREDDDELVTKIEDMLRELRAGEFSYMVFPGPKSIGNTPGYFLEIVSPVGGIPDFKSILEYLRGEIKGSLLARFSELGHGATGARATANVQAEVWYNALHAIASYVSDIFGDSIRRLVDLNYTGVERYPRLKASNIEARNLLEFAQAMALLGNAGAMNFDTPTRDWIRSTVDAPEEDPDEAAQRAELDQQQANADRLSQGIELDPAETARPRASGPSVSTPTSK